MGSIFGIDITGDGRTDFLDDIIMMDIIETDEPGKTDDLDFDDGFDDDGGIDDDRDEL